MKPIKAITPAKGVQILSKQQISIHKNIEKLLMVSPMGQQLTGNTVMEVIICKKVQAIYTDLLQQM